MTDKKIIIHAGDFDLAHFGVLGMKWGVRKDRSGSGRSGKSESGRASKEDIKWSKRINPNKPKNWMRMYNAAASDINNALPGLNKKPKYSAKDALHDPKVKAAYFKEFESIVKKSFEKQADLIPVSPSGKFKVTLLNSDDLPKGAMPSWAVVPIEEARHETDGIVITGKLEDGLIVSIHLDESFKHEIIIHAGDYDLAHYGVLGMKWGYRRDKRQLASLRKRATTIKENKREISKTLGSSRERLKSLEGKKGFKNTWKRFVTRSDVKSWEDFMRVADEVEREVATKTKKVQKRITQKEQRYSRVDKARVPIDKLSNKELKSRIERLSLEKKYASLQPTQRRVRLGNLIVDKFIEASAQKAVNVVFEGLGDAFKK